MSIQSWQLYDLDACEAEFKRILVAGLPTPLQVQRSREGDANSTPRVQIVLVTQQNQSQRFILNPGDSEAKFQPLNVWFFNLTVSVFTNRSANAEMHAELVAKCRAPLQLYKLKQTWTQPVFTIVEIGEQPAIESIEDTSNFDVTTLNFSGLLCIRDGAWSQVA